MTLGEYLQGKNKRAFGRAIGLKKPDNIYHYLSGRKRFGTRLGRRVVEVTQGAVSLEEALADRRPRPPIEGGAA